MMNKYIQIEMQPTACGVGGSFHTEASFMLILIGMDILQDWDIHMGISKVTGKNLFLACYKESICLEYLDALEQHFAKNTL